MIPRGFETRLDPLPKLVLFDLDNTICDYDGARVIRTRYAFEPHFASSDSLDLAVEAAIAHVMVHSTEGSDHFTGILASHGISDPGIAAQARARYIEDRYRGLELYAEALDVVDAVAAVAQVGMITNGPTAIQRPKIELLGIESRFPVILVSEEVGIWKPDPAIFALALARCGCDASDAIYVGDSAHHDIPGAHAAGMRAVWINRRGGDWPGAAPPDAEIRDLYELLPLLGIERPS